MKKYIIFFLFFSSILILTNSNTIMAFTALGGDSGGGTVFDYNTATAHDSVMFSFIIRGVNPLGNLIQASDGNFYGMTLYGGLFGYGTIFRYTASGIYTTLINFNGLNLRILQLVV